VPELTQRKVRLSLEYDGTQFHGWQHQPGERTVEGMLEEALSSVERRPVDAQGASRTDQGVHALGQSAHFISEAPIPTERYAAALNGRLPADMRVTGAEDVAEDFDARRSAVGKLYRYWIDGRSARSVFLARYSWRPAGSVDAAAMRAAAPRFEGELDFGAFSCESGARVESTVRLVHRVTVREAQGLIVIDVLGQSFLYKMVRRMVGSLVEVGLGRHEEAWIADALASGRRDAAGPTAPPQGLFLVRVFYDPRELDKACVRGQDTSAPASPWEGGGEN
jgi:tRNA pseudouridine38-40 synthase